MAWTILAEIVIARSQCGSYCTMRELAEMYPIAAAQIKEDMKQKGHDPQIPHWDLFEINDQVHRLQSIFRKRLQFVHLYIEFGISFQTGSRD